MHPKTQNIYCAQRFDLSDRFDLPHVSRRDRSDLDRIGSVGFAFKTRSVRRCGVAWATNVLLNRVRRFCRWTVNIADPPDRLTASASKPGTVRGTRHLCDNQWSNYSKNMWGPFPSHSPSLPPPFPSPPPPPPFPFPSRAFPFPYPPFTPRPLSRLGSLGERSSSPSGSGRSPAAKRFLVLLEL